MHILRNSVDHGIETPEEREQQGKPRTGQIELRASRERDHVIIEVADDGAGLDVEAIEAKAIEKGVRSADELETMSDSAIYDLVFHPGFSTADEITDTSGRGVRMDVVHDTVTQLDRSVSVDSTQGEGTTVSLRLPGDDGHREGALRPGRRRGVRHPAEERRRDYAVERRQARQRP